jgi:hypothetical protein
MKHLFFFLMTAFMLISCSKKEEQRKEPPALPYEIKIFRLESSGGCQADTTRCASYEIEYPLFKSLSSATSDSLSRKISEAVDTGNPTAETPSIEFAGKQFIADFERAKKEFPEGSLGWYYKGSVNINIITDTLISLEANVEYFTGGAHGGYGTYFVNVRPSTGETVRLLDVFRPGYEEPLRIIAEKEFRKAMEAADTSSFAEEGFEFPDDKFQLNNNFGFTKDGIVFVYNLYEIGPYVSGAPEVLIPYGEIRKWLK